MSLCIILWKQALQVETNWDELEIRDSDGTVLYNGYGNGGDISVSYPQNFPKYRFYGNNIKIWVEKLQPSDNKTEILHSENNPLSKPGSPTIKLAVVC